MNAPFRLAAVSTFKVGCLAAFGILVLPLLYLIEPLWRIRIGELHEDRIGHLAHDTDIFARRLWLQGHPSRTTFVFLAWNPANRQLLEMWKRKFLIIENRWIRRASLGFLPLLRRTRFFAPLPVARATHREYAEAPPTLTFTPEEEEQGRMRMREMGIRDGAWFVCLHARDTAYLANREGFGERRTAAPNFRDCSIDNYLDAANWIASQGGIVLRMGAFVDKPLSEMAPGIIDYATHHRDDFMDVYLLAKCRFVLASSSGPVAVSWIFNVPVASANWAPFTEIGLGHRVMFIPKLLRRRADGTYLAFGDARALGFFEVSDWERWLANQMSDTYERHGVEWVENSPEDILALAKDIIDRLEGREPEPAAVRLQDVYAAILDPLHRTPHAPRLAPSFALKYRHLIEPSATHLEADRLAAGARR